MPDLSQQTTAQRLRIYIGESDRWQGKPLYAALLDTLKKQGVAGATVTRGAAGFGAHSRVHTASLLRLSEDLPLIIDVVDTVEKITQAIESIYPMVREGLITLEDVRVIKYTHRYLNPLPADRPLSEVMNPNVLTLTPSTPVYTAWTKMLETHIKVFPVIDENKRVVGILTDEDLLNRAGIHQRLAIASRLDASLLNEEISSLKKSPLIVADVMTSPVITAVSTEPLGLAVNHMIKLGLKRLPIVDHQSKLVGVLSRLDILRQITNVPLPLPNIPGEIHSAQTVGEIMLSQVPTAALDSSLSELVEKFLNHHTYRLVVIDPQGKAVGLISDSDVIARIHPSRQRTLLNAFLRKTQPPGGQETARDLMSHGVLTAHPDLPLAEAASIMLSQSRKWLIVVDESAHPLGLVDRHRLFESLASSYRAE